MPLDPQIAAMLDVMAQANLPPMSEGTPEQARQAFERGTVGLRNPATLAQVRAVEDGTLPGPAVPLRYRTYRPDVDGSVPTLVFFHGGGFVIGDIETHDDQARLICRDAGVVVVSVDYRLAPEAKFPEPFEDCVAALQWAADHIDTLGGDPQRLAVGGDSAGGNLAAAVALASRESGPRLAAQYLIYPGIDFALEADYPSRLENAEGYFLTADELHWFRAHYLRDEADAVDPRASILLTKDLTGAPPAVIATAEFDPLRDEGAAYAKALVDAGVDVRYHNFDGLIHGFFAFGAFSAGASAAVRELNESFRDLIG
ncbi:MAG TPA: alpha/beta hydrolase [Mycobacteriales bacterium]|nr:alpha/beta hydrolase [Mycobacteriales bacterium]